MKKPIVLLILGILAGCSNNNGSRYTLSDDTGPDAPIRLEHIEDAHPKYEPYSLGGNKDYRLRGESYQIIRSPEGFKQKGTASWYGKKFHGHQTSNGEIYDMYSMTAAHKTLPIPSYVKVTNLDNGKVTIVRVNDRGPFHDGRIIDLSYAAAHKLGVIKTGTANVELEYIPVKPEQISTKLIDNKEKISSTNTQHNFIIQVASSQNAQSTRTLAQKLSQTFSVETFVETLEGKFRVILGPFENYTNTQQILEQVKTQGYPGAFIRKVQ
jgi:rare lipoprotein A